MPQSALPIKRQRLCATVVVPATTALMGALLQHPVAQQRPLQTAEVPLVSNGNKESIPSSLQAVMHGPVTGTVSRSMVGMVLRSLHCSIPSISCDSYEPLMLVPCTLAGTHLS